MQCCPLHFCLPHPFRDHVFNPQGHFLISNSIFEFAPCSPALSSRLPSSNKCTAKWFIIITSILHFPFYSQRLASMRGLTCPHDFAESHWRSDQNYWDTCEIQFLFPDSMSLYTNHLNTFRSNSLTLTYCRSHP